MILTRSRNKSRYLIKLVGASVAIFIIINSLSTFNSAINLPNIPTDSYREPVVEANHGGLGIPRGIAIALPSVRISGKENQKVEREIYGGEGDKAHLGGFTDLDLYGVSPSVWKEMVEYMGVKSVIDVGCGRGTSTSWFILHGLDTACVEGSHDAIDKSIVPNKEKVYTEHDFSRGPWWPSKTYDAVWSVEFLEHVGRNFQQNYMPVFQSAAIIIATSSNWGGWHHVEVHHDDWWIERMQSYGLVYSKSLTERVKKSAKKERDSAKKAPNGEPYNAQHVWLNALVYINPAVASLPKHQHLFSEHGCFDYRNQPNRPCESKRGETEMIDEYLSLKLTKDMDEDWENLVSKNLLVEDLKMKKITNEQSTA